jgi:hypothetical protein
MEIYKREAEVIALYYNNKGAIKAGDSEDLG